MLNRAGRFAVSGAQLSFRRWHRTVHARSSKITHVVRLAIEGLPAHAVEAEAIKQLLNKIGCQFIEWFEPVDACMTEVLAWSSDPSKIPKEFALDIPEPMQDRWREPEVDDADTFEALVSEAPPAPPAEKKCLTFDLLLHLLEVVDTVQGEAGDSSDDDVLRPPRHRSHDTFLGRIDGTGPGPMAWWRTSLCRSGHRCSGRLPVPAPASARPGARGGEARRGLSAPSPRRGEANFLVPAAARLPGAGEPVVPQPSKPVADVSPAVVVPNVEVGPCMLTQGSLASKPVNPGPPSPDAITRPGTAPASLRSTPPASGRPVPARLSFEDPDNDLGPEEPSMALAPVLHMPPQDLVLEAGNLEHEGERSAQNGGPALPVAGPLMVYCRRRDMAVPEALSPAQPTASSPTQPTADQQADPAFSHPALLAGPTADPHDVMPTGSLSDVAVQSPTGGLGAEPVSAALSPHRPWPRQLPNRHHRPRLPRLCLPRQQLRRQPPWRTSSRHRQ